MHRLRPDDHFLLLMDRPETPMHIGGLLVLDVPADIDAYGMIRAHLLRQIPATPLMQVLRSCPMDYDSPVWLRAGGADASAHILRVPDAAGMDEAALCRFVAAHSMERLDLGRPPFQIHIFDRLADGRSALLIKVHHALMDGVGFQTLLGLLCDPPARVPAGAGRSERAMPAPLWLASAAWRFWRQRGMRRDAAARRRRTMAELRKLAAQRGATPVLALSGPNSAARHYAMLSLSLPRLKAASRRLDATLNDLFLASAAGALRAHLLEVGDLPQAPLVANTARSYRRPEHGDFGNRIVAMHPQLATHIAAPLPRLRAIQAAMAAEKARSRLDEALLDQPEAPFGPRDRARKLLGRASVLPGNVTLSNVPGPGEPRFLAGCRRIGNYPMPILGSGRFLNITARRDADRFDLGIMADAAKIVDLDRFVVLLRESFEVYAALAAEQTLLLGVSA